MIYFPLWHLHLAITSLLQHFKTRPMMPLSADSPKYLHVLQNISLIILSLAFAPLCTFIAILSQLIAPFTSINRHIRNQRQWQTDFRSKFRSRTVLVTGVGMSKGLAISRAFYQAGHTVIGADFEPYHIPVCGRYSKALKSFYSLTKPTGRSPDAYIENLIEIIRREQVDLWVSCSGVASAIEDAEAAEAVEASTTCKAVQFGVEMTKCLHEKHAFILKAKEFGLNVPETHLITSIDACLGKLSLVTPGRKFIMKSVGLDDTIRADMNLLPKVSAEDTRKHIKKLNPSPSRPFVLQQYIKGREFCTHSIVVHGQVVAFTACTSSELLMHYKALKSNSELSHAMLRYTEIFARKMGTKMTGHFSIDFLLDESEPREDMIYRLYPIECNPRAHTAVVLMANEFENMSNAYLKLLDNDVGSQDVVCPSIKTGFYWIGHDVVTRGILPLIFFLTLQLPLSRLISSWIELIGHTLTWKDGTYEIWDPWPAWWLYCGYWPGMFFATLLTGNWWSRCNVSTTKMFRC